MPDDQLLEGLKIVGALLGVLAFAWKIWDAVEKYLYVELSVDVSDGGNVSAKTTVENKSPRPKKIDNAVLLIGPENESPVDTFNAIWRHAGERQIAYSTNDIAACELPELTYGPDGRSLIPLPFFYLENLAIGDERLSYRAPIDVTEVEIGEPYSVRFFVWVAGRYHRSTQDCFTLVE